jgi:hypothetical protein
MPTTYPYQVTNTILKGYIKYNSGVIVTLEEGSQSIEIDSEADLLNSEKWTLIYNFPFSVQLTYNGSVAK